MMTFLKGILIYFAATRQRAIMIRLSCAVAAAIGLGALTNADAATKLTVTAVGSTAAAPSEDEGILTGRAPRQSAANDFHDFVCAFNSSGGMLTAIVNAALGAEMDDGEFSVSIDSGKQAQGATRIASDLSFPWYKPNCARPSYLTAHTRALCKDFVWSEPIYEMLVGYFSAVDYDRPLDRHEDVFGTTLCLAGREFPEMLHEVGLSNLNTRLMFEKSPAACLGAVADGRADLTLLPINMAAVEMDHFGLRDRIIGHHHLDRVMTLHAVASQDSLNASDNIALFNRGLESLRGSGEWFEIVEKFADGHDHDRAYDASAIRTFAAKSE